MKTMEYKFKAKHNGEWVYGGIYQEGNKTYVVTKDKENSSFVLADEGSVCIRTPYSNEKQEIWEHDIVKHQEHTGIVRFGEDGSRQFCFYILWMEDKFLRTDLAFWADKVEVIKNEYD